MIDLTDPLIILICVLIWLGIGRGVYKMVNCISALRVKDRIKYTFLEAVVIAVLWPIIIIPLIF